MSMTKTGALSSAANVSLRLTTVVVLPTPPFMLTTEMTLPRMSVQRRSLRPLTFIALLR